MQEVVEPTSSMVERARVVVQLTIHTAHGRGEVVADALRNEAAEHLRSELEVFVGSCRGDMIKLLTDDVRTVAGVARASESSACVIGSSAYA